MKKTIVAGVLLLVTAGSISVEAAGLALGARVSTLGLGVEVTTAFTPFLNGRAGFNYLTYSDTRTESGIRYDADLELQSVTALLDWHPFAGGLRVTAGAVFNDNQLDMTAKPATSFTIGNNTYLPNQVGVMSGKVTFDDVAPYLGIGWGNAVGDGQRFSFALDLGVLFQGSPQAKLTAVGGLLASDPAFLADLRLEEQNLNNELDNFELYPVVGAGLAYRF